MNLRQSVLASFALAALGSVLPVAIQAQQQTAAPPAQQASNRGIVTGTVKDAQSGQPLSGVSVQLVTTSYGATTNDQGVYRIVNVPNGIYTVRATRVGLSPSQKENIRVNEGQTTTADMTMSVQALILQSVVSTGLVDPATGSKSPVSIATVTADRLEVASMNNPLEALAGKVAGLQIRGGTVPGSDVVIQIRNPLSVFGYTQPMIIIDGVIQMQDDPTIGGRSISGNPLDLNGDNIESVEVVRGAAAAALYGQKAANGVISITTKRGNDLALGSTRLTVTNETGISHLGKRLPQATHHRYLVDEENQLVDASGRRIDMATAISSQFVNDPNLFMDNEWGIPTYDNVAALFKTGTSMRGNLQMTQNSLATNFAISAGGLYESGVLREGAGFDQQNLGVNIDYRAGSKLNAGMGLSFTKRYQSDLAINADGTASTNSGLILTAQSICICKNILARDPATGGYFSHPDGVNASLVNPLYFESNRDEWNRRIGAQANATGTFRPNAIFSLTAQGGYSRSDREEQIKWIPVGTLYDTGNIAAGEYDLAQSMDESYNGYMRGGFLTGIGGWTVRGGLRTGGTLDKRNSIELIGDTLTTNERDIDYIRRVQANQVVRDTRGIDYSANLAFDFNQKYIVDLIYRSDGSSQLPPDTRWRSNGSVRAAWSISDEPWWPFADISLFKPRYAIGTAGNNPSFSDRFELYNQNTGTGVVRVSKSNLGNDQIAPEEVTEQEFGLDVTFRDRYSLSLNYVRNTVENVIRPDTILAYTGFDTQRSNLGDLRGDNYEATLEAQWLQKRNLRWSSTLVMDRGRQKITNFPRQCPDAGNSDANAFSGLERYCEGYVFGQMYGRYHVTEKNQLSPRHWSSGTVHTHFGWNDEGLLVALGPNSQFTDMRWGQTIVVDGINYSWGLPITATAFKLDGSTDGPITKVIGQGLPDVSFGLGNQLTLGRFTVNMQTQGQLGGVIFNQAKVRSINREIHVELDQSHKPDYLKKPISYYINDLTSTSCVSATNACYGGLTGGRVLAYPRFMESGSFFKITELRVAYRLDSGISLLRKLGMTGGSIAFVTRDLLTISNYSGYDPLVSGLTNVTSARIDRAAAPSYTNYTMQVRLVF